jgi:aspartate kinase
MTRLEPMSRPIIVQKYGGSSVADVVKIGQVADKVVAAKRAGNDVVVVVSAMGKTTDELLSLAKKVSETGGKSGDPPRRELDMLVSTGERVSMALLSIAIEARGCQAISFTGSQSGILTNDRHFDARIIEVRPHRIEDELARGRVVIVAGYQGMSYKREITTLGRGGSDTTAVALAAALGAERCEIYSDVDGVYSGDPRVVDAAAHLPEIDLATLQEMAEVGAKVLNAQAVEWARRAKIAIYARKTSDALGADGAPARQTIARDGGPSELAQHRVRAVVGLDRVVVLRAKGPLRRFAEVAAAIELPLIDLTAGVGGVSAVVPLLNLPDWDACRARLVAEMRSIEIASDLALVSIVGAELTGASALPKFLATLEQAGATPSTVVAGPLRIAATIESSFLAAAQRALHTAFV